MSARVYLDLRNITRNSPHRVTQLSSRNNSLQFHDNVTHYLLNSVIELSLSLPLSLSLVLAT